MCNSIIFKFSNSFETPYFTTTLSAFERSRVQLIMAAASEILSKSTSLNLSAIGIVDASSVKRGERM